MRELSPCPSCARHVRGSICPFCGAHVVAAAPEPGRLVSRRALTRAAIFAGAALLAGCGGREIAGEEEDDETGGGEQEGSFAHATDDGSGGRRTRRRTIEERTEGGDEVAEDADERRELEEQLRLRDPRERRRCDEPGPCAAPYGAPPFEGAIV